MRGQVNLNWLGHLSRSGIHQTLFPMEGLQKGTIFPELYMPYEKHERRERGPQVKGSGSRIHGVFAEGVEGMDNDRKAMLMNIMAEEFTAIEFNLYLNTHPDDRKALNDFNETVKKLNDLKAQYEKRYGRSPISASSPVNIHGSGLTSLAMEINFA